jgi:hypothetical protein
MARIVWCEGERLGEISDWSMTDRPAEKRMVLGKEILMPKPKDQCQFVSPKPIHWKKKVWVIEDGKIKYTLGELKIQHGTNVTATVMMAEKIG